MSKKNNNLTINFLLSLFSLQELTSSSCSSWQAEAVNFMVWREFKREEKAGRVCFQALVSLPLLPTVTVCMYVCLSVCIFLFFAYVCVISFFMSVCVGVDVSVYVCGGERVYVIEFTLIFTRSETRTCMFYRGEEYKEEEEKEEEEEEEQEGE